MALHLPTRTSRCRLSIRAFQAGVDSRHGPQIQLCLYGLYVNHGSARQREPSNKTHHQSCLALRGNHLAVRQSSDRNYSDTGEPPSFRPSNHQQGRHRGCRRGGVDPQHETILGEQRWARWAAGTGRGDQVVRKSMLELAGTAEGGIWMCQKQAASGWTSEMLMLTRRLSKCVNSITFSWQTVRVRTLGAVVG